LHGDPSSALDLTDAELVRRAGDWSATRAAYERALATARAEPSQAVISEATLGLAECDLALHRPADAVHPLEERLAWLVENKAEPAVLERFQRALARARGR